MISFKWLTLVSTILFIMEGVSFPTLVPPLKWFLVWLLGKVRICSTKSVRGRKTKDQSNTADLADALIGSVLKSQGGESTTLSYFDSTAHQQCIYVFMILWRKHWDDVINKWSHGTFFHYRDSSSGIKGFMTCGQEEDAEEQPFDIENTHFYTNTAIKCSLILVWSKYGFSSIKQCLSKRHCEYQFSRKKEEKLHNKYNSPESPQSFNIF